MQKREDELERVRHLKVAEKTTASQRIAQNRRVEEVQVASKDSLTPAAARRALSEGGSGRDVWREKGGVQSYVSKKHEVFLAQMSLNVKKSEIVKLEQMATAKEDALQRSQQVLDEDIKRFEEFLQSKDKKAHAAMKSAEEMTKKKLEKFHRIKQLKAQLSGLQSEIAKLREQKDECLSLKDFLENLTPQEWKDAKAEEKRDRQTSRKTAWVDQRIEVSNTRMQAELEAEEKALEEKAAEAIRGRRRARREIEEEQKERERELEARRRRIRKKYPTREVVEGQFKTEFGDDSSGEDMPLYFKEPKQLLDVFTAMEESNLFLIQNVQDTEQALEELQQKSAETKRNGDIARDKIRQQITTLDRQMEEEKRKCREFRHKIAQQDAASGQEALVRYLCEKALEVHSACGHEAERDPDTLQMLAAAEAKIEEFLAVFDEAEERGFESVVMGLERAAETQRREMLKSMRKEQLDRKVEERLKASLLRSQAPIHKKTGKQIMYRSPPVYHAQKVVQEDDGYEEAVNQHRVFGIWTGKDGLPNSSQPIKPS